MFAWGGGVEEGGPSHLTHPPTPNAGKTIEDVNVGWALLWDKIRRFVVDRDGRAILDGGHVLMPMLSDAASGGSSTRGSGGGGSRR